MRHRLVAQPLSSSIAQLVGCRKIGYLTHEAAAVALRAQVERVKAAATTCPVRVYRCERCYRWHLTSRQK